MFGILVLRKDNKNKETGRKLSNEIASLCPIGIGKWADSRTLNEELVKKLLTNRIGLSYLLNVLGLIRIFV